MPAIDRQVMPTAVSAAVGTSARHATRRDSSIQGVNIHTAPAQASATMTDATGRDRSTIAERRPPKTVRNATTPTSHTSPAGVARTPRRGRRQAVS
jgi:hypothetical protein